MAVDAERLRIYVLFPNKIIPCGFRVTVDARLARERPRADAEAAVVDEQHGVAECAQRSDLARAARYGVIVAVEVEHGLAAGQRRFGCRNPPAVQAPRPVLRDGDLDDRERELRGLR